tara:strand:- start:290 stop:547 length:258 start_codon:yes stop_codon:yes gene_type:complete
MDMLTENKKQMFEILKNNKEFLNKEENKELKTLIHYLRHQQSQNEYIIKCLRNGINDLQEKNKSLNDDLRHMVKRCNILIDKNKN